MDKVKAATPQEVIKRATERKDFICHYRQQWHGRRGKPSSESQHKKSKRWFEAWYRPEDPEAVGLTKNKFGFAYKRVEGSVRTRPRLAKPGECPDNIAR